MDLGYDVIVTITGIVLVFLILVLLMAIITLEGKIFDAMNSKKAAAKAASAAKPAAPVKQAAAPAAAPAKAAASEFSCSDFPPSYCNSKTVFCKLA